ncbi:hypothetical protein DTO027B5_8579 [Paecilomyces variotii]|nr:hypothetical protein DTO027B3_8641 [Paecilomyces variotii]KAJ9328880.1 hypothetical protein DTO027B5_8579 [Paecilomyces variotii]
MAPLNKTTPYVLKDPYQYHEGLGNFIQSEAYPGAVPLVNNHPQFPPFGTRSEKISGTSFVGPRHKNLHTYVYRVRPAFFHNEYEPYNHHLETANPSPPKHLTPNSYNWPKFELGPGGDFDWTEQHLFGSNGDPTKKTGISIWIFNINKDMKTNTAFMSLDGEALIAPSVGALDIQTELGRLLVRQNEFAVIPRGVKYRVTLPEGKPARGVTLELYQGHFQLPDLGIIGSTGLAHQRDFQIPVAYFEGEFVEDKNSRDGVIAKANNGPGWTVIARLNYKLWSATQETTPFDVTGWQGNIYPYKYDVSRFSYLGNMSWDHHDPSLFVILTAPAYGKAPGTAIVDFAAVGPRWEASEDTPWVPWYHRNTMQEFVFPIINNTDPKLPFNQGRDWAPFGGWLNGSMAAHGENDQEYKYWQEKDTSTPGKLINDGITAGIIETESPLISASSDARQRFSALTILFRN